MKAVGSSARSSDKLTTLAPSPVLPLLLLFPGRVMRLLGPKYMEGAAALTILALGQFVNVAPESVLERSAVRC